MQLTSSSKSNTIVSGTTRNDFIAQAVIAFVAARITDPIKMAKDCADALEDAHCSPWPVPMNKLAKGTQEKVAASNEVNIFGLKLA